MADVADFSIRYSASGTEEVSAANRRVEHAIRRAAQAAEIKARADTKVERIERSLTRAQRTRASNTNLIVQLEARLVAAKNRSVRASTLATRAAEREARANANLANVNRNLASSITQASNARTGLAGVFQRNSFGVVNAANQFGDLSVQIQSGTNAFRALSQQLPQITGFLGPHLAIAGVVASLGLGILGSFLQARKGIEGAKDSMDAFTDATDILRHALEQQELGLDGLIGKYGDLSDEILAVHKNSIRFAKQDARAALNRKAEEILETLPKLDRRRADNAANLENLISRRRQHLADLAAYPVSNDFTEADKRFERSEITKELNEFVRRLENIQSNPDFALPGLLNKIRSGQDLTTRELTIGIGVAEERGQGDLARSLNRFQGDSIELQNLEAGRTGSATSDAAEGINRLNRDLVNLSDNLTENLSDTMADITEIFLDGGGNITDRLQDLFDDFARDLARRAVQDAIFDPLADGIVGFGKAIAGNIFGGSNVESLAGTGSAVSPRPSSFRRRSREAITTTTLSDFVTGRESSPTTGHGDIVATPRGPESNLGSFGSEVVGGNVIINNYAGPDVSVSHEGTNAQGDNLIAIGRIIAGEINRGTGPVPEAMKRNYGLQQRLT